MRKTAKKMLAASTICIIMSGSFIGGAARVLAEQYYGWNDGTGERSPFFLYATPTNETKRKIDNSNIVYCFNKDDQWPENWEAVYDDISKLPYSLPLYNSIDGTDDLFSKYSKKHVPNASKSLVAVLANGYPSNNKLLSDFGINEHSAKKVTQLAVWTITDGLVNYDQYSLTEQEKKALDFIKSNVNSNTNFTLKLYISQTTGNKKFQNLLGSTLIPLPKPEPMPKPEPKPQKPTKPSAMASQPSGKALPKTNDTGSLMTALGAGLLSLLGLGFLAKRKRK
ncbi:TPA: thioester-forming surface-anchored protein [Streptococcus equi subsp. zooepidemicus]|nr:thioester-forming surface-anchored protein [Streptococcus equi subsp. zooepidemicus]